MNPTTVTMLKDVMISTRNGRISSIESRWVQVFGNQVFPTLRIINVSSGGTVSLQTRVSSTMATSGKTLGSAVTASALGDGDGSASAVTHSYIQVVASIAGTDVDAYLSAFLTFSES